MASEYVDRMECDIMYCELCETSVSRSMDVIKRYPRMAYLLTNVFQPYVDGVTLDVHGELYAIADAEGKAQLYETARVLRASGISAFIDDIPLDIGKDFFTG